MVEGGEGGLCEQECCNFFAVSVGSPVEGSAAKLVLTVDINAFSEVHERDDHVFLGGQVERVEACFSGEFVIHFVLLDKVLDDIEMPTIRSIE